MKLLEESLSQPSELILKYKTMCISIAKNLSISKYVKVSFLFFCLVFSPFESNLSANDDFMKGFTFGGMLWPEGNLNLVDYNLDRLETLGVNSIILIIDWYVDDHTDPTIEPWYRDKPGFPDTQWFSPTLFDQDVIEIINKAHNKGIRVALKLHVETLDWPFGGIGRYGLQIDTGRWDELFASYLNFISHYATLAESNGVEIFILGCELDSMTISTVAGLNNPDERWRYMISEARKIYSGQMTYSCALHGDWEFPRYDPQSVTFWDALDYIGFEIYRGMTKDDSNPSLAELKDGVRDIFNNWVKPLSEQYNKKVIIPEINYHSFDGVNSNPIGLNGSSPYNHNSPVDHQEQADCYEAVLEVVAEITENEDYLDGIFWWAGYLIDPNGNYDWVESDKYDPIWFKPAEDVVRKYWIETLKPAGIPSTVLLLLLN
jgi:hypothetical protein